MSRVLVTGAAGILGDAILRTGVFGDAVGVGHQTAADLVDVCADLRDRATVDALVESTSPDIVIHTVAATDVDACERAPGAAYATSALTTLNLADALAATGRPALLLYVSTDQVYSGPGPHREDTVAPANAYGAAKHAGELAAARAPQTLVLRTNFVGRSHGARPSYTDWLAGAARRGETIHVDTVAAFSPLSLRDLIAVIHEAVDRSLTGTYNVGAADGIRKIDFARAVAGAAASDGGARVVAADRPAPGRAPREPDLVLDVSRFETAIGHRLPNAAVCVAQAVAEVQGSLVEHAS